MANLETSMSMFVTQYWVIIILFCLYVIIQVSDNLSVFILLVQDAKHLAMVLT